MPASRHGFLLTLFFIIAFPSGAAPLSPADRNNIEQRQQQLLQQSQQQRDELDKSISITGQQPSSPGPAPAGPCFVIQHIVLQGSTLISPTAQQKLVAVWQGKCLDIKGITAAVNQVSDWYISRGYITSRAFLTPQNLATGTLRIVVLEGKLRAIHLDGKTPLMLKMAFPGLVGRVLNLRDIEQGMEQINRLRTSPVQIEILPDTTPGYSVVNLTARPEFPLTASVSLDNSGQKSTGEKQLTGVLTGNNLLGIADKWFVSGGRSSDFATGYDAQSLQTGVSVPWGYGLLDYTWSWSDYRTTFINNGFDWVSTGSTQNHRLNGSWVVFRNGDIKTGVTAGLTHYTGRNWLNHALLSTSSRKLTSISLGINHTQKIAGGVATFNPVFSRGMPWFDAESDAGKSGDLPKAQFRKWSASASYQRPLNDRLWWLTSLYGQWSPDRLYASERLTLGGESSVRGFKEQYISGDNGGYWRNELNYALGALPFIGQINATVALDGGWLEKDHLDQQAAGTLWGASAGLSTGGRWYASQISVGTPLHYPDWLGPDHLVVNWRLTFMY
ncbi:peptide transporter [Mangrovibacter sp. MFB070]|uniref:ShlB/FhaC/HecB family hemolysin secretion/activation protein n=1 Tax=Mangrovibacter sp. MFB070 TaxID=1224318 RepID=UPI0004D8EB01|nr:ShlB/FhaC/HecB family hemolysin secretion/activation protein [Mangrovibacter sp. MFB070]KEA52611.1 peptide transporter [Mangrovibacter sp. MFB070]